MAVRHNATALPAPSRRNFITSVAAGAAGVALTAGTATASAAPDAELLARFARWREVDAEFDRVDDLGEDLREKAHCAVPVPPEIVRAGSRGIIPRREIEKDLETGQMARRLLRGQDAQRAAAEIIAQANIQLSLRDRYDTAISAERERNGHDAAVARLEELRLELDALAQQIAVIPAKTVAGLAAKLVMLRYVLVPGDDDGAMEDDFWNFFGAQVIREAEQIAGLPQSLRGARGSEEV